MANNKNGEYSGLYSGLQTYANALKGIKRDTINIAVTNFMKPFKEAFNSFHQLYENAKKNPDSYINYLYYKRKLDKYHWAWPFRITGSELKDLLDKSFDEETFDNMMLSFFTKDRVDEMFEEILVSIPRRHKVIFKQIISSYYNKNYAIANNSIMSIIDNLLSELLINKGRVNRFGILNPVIQYYSKNYKITQIDFIFQLQMLSSSIDFIFGSYNFNDKIKISTNKKIRRHLAIHGYMYSNKKNDTIMLLNTLISLLETIDELQPFYNTIGYDKNRKEFIIDTKKVWVVDRRMRKKLGKKIEA